MKIVMMLAIRHGGRCKNALAGVFIRQKLQCIITVSILLLCTVCSTKAPDELDAAIREAADYLSGRIPEENRIFFVNIQSSSKELSEYIIGDLMTNLGYANKHTLVIPIDPDALQAEFSFQTSGEVDDFSAVSIGRALRADAVVTGKVEKTDKNYRLTIRALDTETAQIQGMFNRNIPAGKTINALVSGK